MDFHQLSMCIDIVEIWFVITNGQISSVFACDMSNFSLSDNNLSSCIYHRIFTKVGMCIDIVEIWIEIANGQISSIFDRFICSGHVHIFFLDIDLSKFQWIYTKLGMCIDIMEIWFGIAYGQILSIFDSAISPWHHNGRVLLFHAFIRRKPRQLVKVYLLTLRYA